MLFSSMVFLWVFLPICLIGYYLIQPKFRNVFLLIASLIFYAWGEPRFVFLMVLSIIVNYIFAILIEDTPKEKKAFLTLGIVFNLALLGYFKYFNFLIENINLLFQAEISAKTIVLPIGISFFTFQIMSYLIDVYRNPEIKAQRNIINLGLYIALFPQLIAGPIVKYKDIEKELLVRNVAVEDFSYGIKRFVIGLSKKVLLANNLAVTVDLIFAQNAGDLSSVTLWLGAIGYMFQIYYDFSGYSDMAIGLGRMFGFHFQENFIYPYLSNSIKEFWRRWHISLSTWFKEYLYIPLGGNRKGKVKLYRNLLVVFFATGLWHGASWNFIIWGLWHGLFALLERMKFGGFLAKTRVFNKVYVFFVVIIGWVFFRADNLNLAVEYLKGMFLWHLGEQIPLRMVVSNQFFVVLLFSILLSGILQSILQRIKRNEFFESEKITWIDDFAMPAMLIVCIICLVSGTYNPFIYFRF